MSIFLRAEWRKLIMMNYVVDSALLQDYIPYGTELDLWNNQCYVSLIGFMFLNTRVKGVRIPFHINFEEVNLRFYVRRRVQDEVRRGVVFIKEIVPRYAISFIANWLYKESYVALKMGHHLHVAENEIDVSYHWTEKRRHQLRVKAESEPIAIPEGSEEEFITEHFWGYTKRGPKATSEYQVEHPRWQLYPVKEYSVDVHFERVYGPKFACLDSIEPVSVFLAEGSEICVRKGNVI